MDLISTFFIGSGILFWVIVIPTMISATLAIDHGEDE